MVCLLSGGIAVGGTVLLVRVMSNESNSESDSPLKLPQRKTSSCLSTGGRSTYLFLGDSLGFFNPQKLPLLENLKIQYFVKM